MEKIFLFKSIRAVMVFAIAAGIAVLLVTLKPKEKHEVRPETGRLVEVLKARAENVNMIISGYGTVKPREVLKLVAEIKGRIINIDSSFKEGVFVKKNAALIKIDSRTYQLEVDRQQTQIEQTKAEIKKLQQEIKNLDASIKISKSDTLLAQADFSRLKKLSSRNVVSQTTLDKAEQKYLASLDHLQTLKNQLALTGPLKEQLEAQLNMGKVMLSQAKLDFEKTDISTPFDGWVLEKDIEEGQHVNAGQYFGSIYKDKALDIELNIPAKDLKWLQQDLTKNGLHNAEIVFDNKNASQSWKGRVSRIKAQMDKKTRTLPVVIEIEDSELDNNLNTGSLRPGMFVSVMIKGINIEQVFVIPRHVLHTGNVVYIMAGDHLQIRHVNILRSVKDSVYVDKGLSNGDLVIKSPLSGAVEGMKVRINTA